MTHSGAMAWDCAMTWDGAMTWVARNETIVRTRTGGKGGGAHISHAVIFRSLTMRPRKHPARGERGGRLRLL